MDKSTSNKKSTTPNGKTIISQINEEVKTNALDMTQKSIISQSNEEVKTDTLDITLITTPEENLLETRETTKSAQFSLHRKS